MNILLYLFLLSSNVELVMVTSTILIPNQLRKWEHMGHKIKKFVRRTRAIQAHEHLEQSACNSFPTRDLRDEQLPETSPILKNNFEEWQKQQGIQIEHQMKEASPDPTIHKYKSKHKIHSHSHTHNHGSVHTENFFTNPVISPVSSVIIPSGSQQWHQSLKFLNTGYHDNNFATSNLADGINNQGYGSINLGTLTHGHFQQNGHFITDHNKQQNIHFINNQNSHFINQNNHLNNGLTTTGFGNKALNVQIANLYGHNNAFSQSTNKHIFFHGETNPILEEDDIRRKNSENVNFQTQEDQSQDDYGQKKYDLRLQEEPISENDKSVEYDSEINNILNVLDMRSHLQARPTVKVSPYYEKNSIGEVETFEKSIQHPHACTYTWYLPEAEELIYEGKKDTEKWIENEGFPENSEKSDDVRLQSPYIIQIPNNSNFKFHRWSKLRNKRSYRSSNSTISSNDATLSSNISNVSFENSTAKFVRKEAIHSIVSKQSIKNLNDTLKEYKSMINIYRKGINQKEELIFADFLDGIVDDFQNKELINLNAIKKIKKRAAPIVKLFNNPNVKLDVPKTLENIGTITRNAFEDERAPMYHVRNLMGSTKNAVLSAMRIPPQNFIIPSKYQIENINPEEISDVDGEVVGGISRSILSRSNFRNDGATGESQENNAILTDPYGIVETFTRVGNAIRDSVRSGQNTLSHIGDIAHNARQIYQTTKNTVPRVILPYSKAPVVMRSRFKVDRLPTVKKAVIITPKVVAVKEPLVGSDKSEADYVGMGNILDALGISKPDKDQLDLERFVIKTPGKGNVRGIYIPPIGDVKSVNGKEIPSLKSAGITLNRINEKVSSPSGAMKDVLVENETSNILEKTNNQVEQMGTNIPKYLEYLKKNANESINTLHKHTFKNNANLNSKNGNIVVNNRVQVRNFTKEEEKKIIDKFLDNIFKMDKKHAIQSKSMLYREKEKQDHNLSFNKLTHLKQNPKSVTAESENEINFSLSQNHLGKIEHEINKLMKNLTMDISVDRINHSSRIHEENKPDVMKTKKNDNTAVHEKKKIREKVKPKIYLGSRFGGNIQRAEEKVTMNPPITKKELGDDDDEGIRRVDEYVVNDIVSKKNGGNLRDSKIENILQLMKDSSEESSESFHQFLQSPEENPTPYYKRTMLWTPEDRTNIRLRNSKRINEESDLRDVPFQKINKRSLIDPVVGLDLPPELFKPFMARASDKEVEHIFETSENKENIVGTAQPSLVDNVYSAKQQLAHKKDDFINLQVDQISSIPPTDLLQQMRSRVSTSGFVRKRAKSRFSHGLGAKETEKTYQYAKDDTVSLKNPTRQKGYSEYILCSLSYQNSPIVCENSYENSGYIPEYEVDRTHHQEKVTDVGQSRTSMLFGDNLKKPFMGLENKDMIENIYEEYNEGDFID